MIKLKNIINEDKAIECDFIPEDANESGHLKLYKETEASDVSFPSGYEWCSSHIAHAIRFLLDCAADEVPREKTLMWY